MGWENVGYDTGYHSSLGNLLCPRYATGAGEQPHSSSHNMLQHTVSDALGILPPDLPSNLGQVH
jgi:hypothetical protein